MSKVLVDRELLERTAAHLEWDGSEPMTTIQFAQKCDGLAGELRRSIAQPAEAEGARDYLAEFAEGEVEAKTAIEELQDALSAVTAERDRLREEMAELWKRIDKFQSQSHGITALAEIERLRAEVERYVPLHEAVQRAAGELPEGWAIQLYIERDGGGVELIGPDGTEDFATNNERLDYTVIDALEAAMAAKEAR